MSQRFQPLRRPSALCRVQVRLVVYQWWLKQMKS